MVIRQRHDWLNPRAAGGFTLVEQMISVAILALFMAACFAGILMNRLIALKAKEEAIAMDFLIHYVETVKGLPFNEVAAGRPINPLLDGSGDGPNIRIPGDSSWVSIATEDYEVFHPDLMWVQHRNPQLRVALSPQRVGGVLHDVHLNVRMAWDAPLRQAGRLEVQMDLVRMKDL
jgi:prepilin-type N-terminal cleavage/methylation domain-containing protein